MKAVDGDEELIRHRIVAASLEIVGAQGFGTSLAHIAEVAGVTPEVLLQHFGTRELLNTATIGELFDRYDYSFDNAPVPGDDLSAWIDALCAYVHKENLEVFGQGFWDVALSVHKLTGSDSRTCKFVASAVIALAVQSRRSASIHTRRGYPYA